LALYAFFEGRDRSLAFNVETMRFSLIVALSVGLPACTISQSAPDLTGQDVHLTILHTADLHSRFFPYYFAPGQIDKDLGLLPKPGQTTAVVGGIARVGTIIKCIRGFRTDSDCQALEPITGPPAARSLHLDSGDIFEGAPVFNQFQGEVEMRAMSQLGVSAMALGNHEFDKGSVNLELQYQKFGGFPIMAANYMFADPTDPTQPKLADVIGQWTTFNVDGLRVGVIGMGNLSSIQGILEGGNTLGVRPIEATQAMAQTVELVRPSVDLLVTVSHLGLDEDEGVAAASAEMEDQNTAIAQAGVDVILGGHLHIVLDPPKDLPHFDPTTGAPTGHTVLCHSGAFAKYVGRLDLVVHVPTADEKAAGNRPTVKAYTYKIIPITDQIPMDADLANMLEPYQLKMNKFLNLNQVYSLVGCPLNSSTCPKLQRNDPNGGDSQLGNMVAASMRLREGVEADYGVTNSLGIRADFESGPLNLEEMYNVFPFDNTITTMFLSGDETQQMLDAVAARSAERGCRTQAQVSGIYFDLICGSTDPDCQARLCPPDNPTCTVEGCARNIYLGDGCRMPDGTFNGTTCKPLDKYGEYRVAVNDYIAQGGSGFLVLKRNTTKFNTGISLRDALVDYIRTLPKRCDPMSFTNVVGVTCKDSQGETYDCTASCCGHDDQSGPVLCSANAPQFAQCAANNMVPSVFDYTNTACLVPDDFTDPNSQAHDGRIQTFVGGAM
jgi:5'-nucleotidase